MSTVSEMPEILDAMRLMQDVQVVHEDESVWALEGLNAAIEKAVRKAYKYTKKTSVTLKFSFTPGKFNELLVEGSLDVKDPKAAPTPMVAYTDSRGRLFGEDPAQQKLPLKPTSIRKGEQ